jgi:hypothetical protein
MFARFAKRALQLGRCVPSVHPKPALPYCVRFHSTEGGPPKPPDPDSTDGIVEDDELDAFMLDDELDTIVENVPKMLPQPVAKEGSEEYFTRVQEVHFMPRTASCACSHVRGIRCTSVWTAELC